VYRVGQAETGRLWLGSYRFSFHSRFWLALLGTGWLSVEFTLAGSRASHFSRQEIRSYRSVK
jgi:hypothetical protein